MKVTIVYDNTAFRKDLQANWGFSALVELANLNESENEFKRILFDTGGNGKILLSNMEKLGIDPASIDEVFISHPHFDHTGGLSEFLKVNPNPKIYVPSSFTESPEAGEGEVITIKGPQKIHDNVFSTGELEGIEQSMGVITDLPAEASAKEGKGIILIVGCSHPDVGNILDTAKQFGKIYAIIGGMHGFSEFELFKDLELICPTHCTQYKEELKRLYPQKYIEGGAGRIIEI